MPVAYALRAPAEIRQVLWSDRQIVVVDASTLHAYTLPQVRAAKARD
jgi:hypothetical protein